MGERGGLRVQSLSGGSRVSSAGRPFLLIMVWFVLCGLWLFFGDGVLVICVCGRLLVWVVAL